MINYSTGCAFNLKDIFYNFPFNKLKFTCKDALTLINDLHRNILVMKIFKECFKLIINEIINNNITFKIPGMLCYIHMKRTKGESFKSLRRAGKWKDVDFITSNFSGYEIGFFMYGKRTERTKTIYLNNEYKNRITLNTNLGMNYGLSNKDKEIKDYLNILMKQFTGISKLDIRRILVYGWKTIYRFNSYGGDVCIRDNTFWSYIGRLKKNPIDHFNYYRIKLALKLRILYRRKKIKWDGYYYFALNDELYQDYLKQLNKKGRPRKNFIFKNIYLYLIFEECNISLSGCKYIFKIPYNSLISFKFFLLELKTNKAELILKRNPLKFKDILINENDYSIL